MKLSERSIRIKELIGSQVDMGTFGLVELELQAFDKDIAELKNCNLQNVSSTEGQYCECAEKKPEIKAMWIVCAKCGKPIKDE